MKILKNRIVFLCLFVFLLPSVGISQKKVDQLLFPGKHKKKNREYSGNIIALEREGKNISAFFVKLNNQNVETQKFFCREVRLYTYNIMGDLIKKEAFSCNRLTEGMKVQINKFDSNITEIIVTPKFAIDF